MILKSFSQDAAVAKYTVKYSLLFKLGVLFKAELDASE